MSQPSGFDRDGSGQEPAHPELADYVLVDMKDGSKRSFNFAEADGWESPGRCSCLWRTPIGTFILQENIWHDDEDESDWLESNWKVVTLEEDAIWFINRCSDDLKATAPTEVVAFIRGMSVDNQVTNAPSPDSGGGEPEKENTAPPGDRATESRPLAGAPEPRRRGRPTVYDRQKDQRIVEAWRSDAYKTYEDLGRELGVTGDEVRAAIERERKRAGKNRAR
jgi:hypothetical protein